MSNFEAVILGLVQGLGEFLPISSSAHLVLVPWLMGWEWAGLKFDVALHMGTLLAVAAFFWRDWLILFKEGVTGKRSAEGKMFWYLVVATIPGAAFGYFFEEQAATIFREPLLIGIMLIVMGVALYLVDTRAPQRKELTQINLFGSLFVGLSQAFAIIPGVSRAGVTMTAGRFLGLSREASARFSFLLSTPIIFGAGIMELSHMSIENLTTSFFVGVVSSALVGFLSIKFLLKYLTTHSFVIFVWYRFALGTLVLVVAFIRG